MVYDIINEGKKPLLIPSDVLRRHRGIQLKKPLAGGCAFSFVLLLQVLFPAADSDFMECLRVFETY